MSRQFYVATRKGLFKVEKDSSGWKLDPLHFVGDPVSMILPDRRNGHLYAALKHGHFGVKMHVSADGGKTWEERATPTYPEKPAGITDKDGSGREVEWKTVDAWSLEAGVAEHPGHLWCGTIPGGLFRSMDGGRSWELVRSLWDRAERHKWFGGGADQPGIHSICVDPTDNRKVTVAVSCGGVWHSPDNGETWESRAQGMRAEYMPPDQAMDPDIQDPHRMVQCPASPAHLWAQHHNGIFRTTDHGKSWTEIEEMGPSTFGFATVVHPLQPDTAWFIPAIKDEKRIPVDGKLVVTRTRDGGKSYQVLNKGLPEGLSYDLVFRHAMDVDRTGDTLAFGSSTGGLWVSEDQGDGWTLVSAHLPPVYALRFA